MIMARRRDASLPVTLVYFVFMILYTWYISRRLGSFGGNKADYLFYYLGLLATGTYSFFILQGLVLRLKNWGMLLLLPAGILILSVLSGWLIVTLVHIHSDGMGMMLVTLITLAMSFFALRWVGR